MKGQSWNYIRELLLMCCRVLHDVVERTFSGLEYDWKILCPVCSGAAIPLSQDSTSIKELIGLEFRFCKNPALSLDQRSSDLLKDMQEVASLFEKKEVMDNLFHRGRP